MKKGTDQNSNVVMTNDKGNKAFPPCQFITNMRMDSNRTAESIYMSVRKADIDSNGVIDYEEADNAFQRVNAPLDYILEFVGAEDVLEYTRIQRKIHDAIVEYNVNPPVQEV